METISDLSMGKPQSAGALTMVPLSGNPVGVGEDWRYEGKLSLGKALYLEVDLIHFSAFGK